MAPNFFSELEIMRFKELLKLSNLEILLGETTSTEIHEIIQKEYKSYSASISHCQHFGGFAATFENAVIGFDIEEAARVTKEIAARVSPEGVDVAPSSLWSAKEATFKALRGQNQPQVISEIQLVEWQILDSQTETYRLKDCRKWNIQSAYGLCYRKGIYQFAFSVVRP